MKQSPWSKDIGMRRRSCLGPHQMRPVVAILATTIALGVSAEAPPTKTRVPDRPLVTELPPEVKRLIDAAKRLNEQPGLILNRDAIYQTLEVRPTSTTRSRSTDGARGMGEGLQFERPQDMPNWEASLQYAEYPKSASWSVKVELIYSRGPNCYPSRLVEAYWGQPFAYRPLGVHAFMDELRREQIGLPPTGPHDGEPYSTEFGATHANSANVFFRIAPGGCLSTIVLSRLFNFNEYSDENIYHK
jgi:hypothetical protein